MKRSEVNRCIQAAKEFLDKHCFKLPPFAFWSPADWARAGREAGRNPQESTRLGPDDFGSGDFRKIGLLLFTLRNGNLKDRRT